RAALLAGGAAGHPWLARWVAEAGEQLGLPAWRGDGWVTFYLPPAVEAVWARRLPLIYVEAPAALHRQWADQGWRTAGEVPGLLPLPPRPLPPSAAVWERRYPLTEADRRQWGIRAPELARRVVAEALADHPAWTGWAVRWEGTALPPRRRHWSPSGDRRILAARLLTLLLPLPAGSPAGVGIGGQTGMPALGTAQQHWGWAPVARAPADPPPGAVRGRRLSRREQMLAYWDPWRGGDRR
ncbi:MAG: hypothetical protein OWV35_10755, partial [Firmicutes bacterium]|nr:hypothetical protein [Bacillota bacterium]